MIDFNSIKEKMNEDEIKKLDSGLARLRVLAPDAREQILTAMEAMITCENLKIKESNSLSSHVNKSENNLCKNKLLKLLDSKYDDLKSIAKCNPDSELHELHAVSKVLKLGTYDDGANAIDILIKINLIKYLIDPEFLFEDMED